jgi:hypothetical protein
MKLLDILTCDEYNSIVLLLENILNVMRDYKNNEMNTSI